MARLPLCPFMWSERVAPLCSNHVSASNILALLRGSVFRLSALLFLSGGRPGSAPVQQLSSPLQKQLDPSSLSPQLWVP